MPVNGNFDNFVYECFDCFLGIRPQCPMDCILFRLTHRPFECHSGNTNLNHPLQSLHAMHPGGGGDVVNPEISSQEAAAMVAAAAQHQCLQLSLGRSTNTAGDPGSSRTALLIFEGELSG